MSSGQTLRCKTGGIRLTKLYKKVGWKACGQLWRCDSGGGTWPPEPQWAGWQWTETFNNVCVSINMCIQSANPLQILVQEEEPPNEEERHWGGRLPYCGPRHPCLLASLSPSSMPTGASRLMEKTSCVISPSLSFTARVMERELPGHIEHLQHAIPHRGSWYWTQGNSNEQDLSPSPLRACSLFIKKPLRCWTNVYPPALPSCGWGLGVDRAVTSLVSWSSKSKQTLSNFLYQCAI